MSSVCLHIHAVQIWGLIFGSKVAKLSGASQKNPHFSYFLVLCMRIVFWQYLLMGGELGNESNIDVLLRSSATPPPIFASIGNDNFVAKFVSKKWRFWVSADISSRSSRHRKNVFILVCFVSARVQQCRGQCLQISSPNSQWFPRYHLRMVYPFFGGPSS